MQGGTKKSVASRLKLIPNSAVSPTENSAGCRASTSTPTPKSVVSAQMVTARPVEAVRSW